MPVRLGILMVLVQVMTMSPVKSYALPANLVSSHLEQAVDSTDRYLELRDYYIERKQEAIGLIKDRLRQTEAGDSTELLVALAKAYRRYDVDSAAFYYEKAIENSMATGDSVNYYRSVLGLCAVNTLRGMVREAVNQFEAIAPTSLRGNDRPAYYDAGFDVFLTSASFYPEGQVGKDYLDKALAMSDALASCLDDGDPHKMYHKGWSALYRGDYPTALAEMRSALDATPFGNELYARVAATLAEYYDDKMNDEASAYYLALSAMSDIAAGTRETTSLQKLGLELYKQGDIDRAYRYLNVALDNSIASGSKIRTLTELNALPIISKAYNDKDASRIRWLYVLIAFLSIAVVSLVAVVVANRRSHRRLVDYKSRLSENNTMKDEYIKQILSLCSSYIERIEELNRLIIRKLKAGQAQDLLKMVESGDMLRQQEDKFLKSFDEAFIKIYPDFAEELNQLLNPKDRFPETQYKKLTPELRIAAFMRLGVDDSSRIARFLGLSLNTVYTYRNKLKNRAIDRENFEQKIKNIGGFL